MNKITTTLLSLITVTMSLPSFAESATEELMSQKTFYDRKLPVEGFEPVYKQCELSLLPAGELGADTYLISDVNIPPENFENNSIKFVNMQTSTQKKEAIKSLRSTVTMLNKWNALVQRNIANQNQFYYSRNYSNDERKYYQKRLL